MDECGLDVRGLESGMVRLDLAHGRAMDHCPGRPGLRGAAAAPQRHEHHDGTPGCADRGFRPYRVLADGNVEPAAAVLDRATALIAQLERQHCSRDILLVSHGDILQILQAGFSGMDPSKHRLLPHLATAEIRPAPQARNYR